MLAENDVFKLESARSLPVRDAVVAVEKKLNVKPDPDGAD